MTVPFTRNIEAANARKRLRYDYLTQDIEDKGYKCSNLPLEIGSRGHITTRNRETLVHLCHTFKIGKFSNVIKNCSKLALLGSYSIFIARSAKDWTGSVYLKPWKLYSFFYFLCYIYTFTPVNTFVGVHLLCTPMYNQ